MSDLGKIVGILGDVIPGPDVFDLGSSIYNTFNQSTATPPVQTGPVAPMARTPMAGTNCSRNGTYRVVSTIDAATGQVIKQACAPRRRRRGRLATTGDIKDLASLKAVLGNGENFKMWIATRGK